MSLPQGNYRFRADLNGTQFWSAEINHCDVPTCASATVTVTKPLTVTVQDTDGAAKAGIKVYAFDGTTYTNYSGTTDANGQVTLTLPEGDYRFRADFNGTQFWSGETNHCALPGCTSASVTVTLPVTVSVQSQTNEPYPNLSVYVFDGTIYSSFHGTTNASGKVSFTLPQGAYHFRADYDGVQFWSAQTNECTLPGCTSATVTLPGGTAETTTTIDYTYDPLYRLTSADYSTGDAYHYAYDSVGNRLTQESMVHGLTSNVSYEYDSANRLTTAGGQAYTFDANGNLLSDGQNEYVYDSANRLTSVNGAGSYTYNGLGDRLSQNGVNYTLDLNSGLTQVLSDGTITYTYGLGRISQTDTAAEYFLGDALGSVRQLTDSAGAVTYAASYSPYGEVSQSGGAGQSAYGYTGEQQDDSGMVYLRARYYDANNGRFLSKDTWDGDANNPMSMNRWSYGLSNPINLKDPTGLAPTNVDCNQINPVLSNMRELCKTANGDVDDSTKRYYVLTAREQIFREIAKISITQGSVFGEGYRWAGVLLSHFLDGGGHYNVNLASNSSFQSDRGTLRATKLKLPQLSDDAQEITPLLHVFLNYIKENQICNGLIPDMHLKGEKYYVKGSARALDTGWWGAFGHVNIDGDYVNSWISQEGYGFYISTSVTYTINDHYTWGHKAGTPLPIGAFNIPPLWELDGVRKFVGMVDIPHAWEVSLREYGWAKEFDFDVTWSERMDIIVPPGFSSFYTQGLYDDLGN